MEEFCKTCGNEIGTDSLTCPFCGTSHSGMRKRKPSDLHRTVNIEMGRPTIELALAKLERELERAKKEGIAVVTVIHGYGASGKGGSIRTECRKMLDFYKDRNSIHGYIEGEHFSKKAGATRNLLRRLPSLLHNGNLNKKNKGITVIEL